MVQGEWCCSPLVLARKTKTATLRRASHQHPSPPCFPSFLPLSFLAHWISASSATCYYSPRLPNQPSTPHAPCLHKPPTPSQYCYISVKLYCISRPCPCCFSHVYGSLSIQGHNEASTKAHWWEAQCERGWPQPRATRTGHKLPEALPPHKGNHCGQRPERAQRKEEGEWETRYPVQTT